MFRPIRGRIKTSIDDQHEQMSMVSEKRTTNLRRTSSVYDDDHPTENKERRRPPRIQRRFDTVAIV